MSLYSDFEFEQLKDSLDRFKDICLDDGEDEYETHVAALQLALEALSCEPQATRNLLYKYADAVTDCRLHICPERYIEEGQKILREREQRRLYAATDTGNNADIPADNTNNRRFPVMEARTLYGKPAETSLLDKCREFLRGYRVDVYENGRGECLLVEHELGDFFKYIPATNDLLLKTSPQYYRLEEVAEIVDKLKHSAKADSVPATDNAQ